VLLGNYAWLRRTKDGVIVSARWFKRCPESTVFDGLITDDGRVIDQGDCGNCENSGSIDYWFVDGGEHLTLIGSRSDRAGRRHFRWGILWDQH